MKIAMLTDLFYPYLIGGAERQFYEIAKRLAKKHDVHVYTMSIEGYPSEETVENIKIHRYGIAHPMGKRSMISLASYFLSQKKIVKELKKFDIIHANQAAGIFSHFYDGDAPFLITIHDLYLKDWKKHFSFPLYLVGKNLEYLLIKGDYDKIITISEMTRKKIIGHGMKAPIIMIHPGLDLEKFNKIKGRKRNGVVFVGRLVKYKNIDMLIKSMKKVQEKFPGKALVIIGSGEEESRLKELASSLGVNAKFLGFASEEEKIREIKSAEIFVSMSSVEGFGLALVEAMAMGTPVLANRLECYGEFCKKGNSMLINGNEENLIKGIMNLLKSKAIAKKLSASGIKTARNFSWKKVAERTEKEYEKTIKSQEVK